MLFRLLLRFPPRSCLVFLLCCFALTTFVPHTVYAAGVVGDGTPESCTRNAVANRIAGGGTVTFNCGPDPVTIPITETLMFQDHDVVLDGGNLVTLEGVSGVRMIYFRTWGFNASQKITIKNMTIRGARVSGQGENSNGAAILIHNQSAEWDTELPIMLIDNVQFIDNRATITNLTSGPSDYGGGAIFVGGGKLTVKNSAFIDNEARGGAGAAIHGLVSNITVINTTFTNNRTTANPGAGLDPNTVEHMGHGGAIFVDNTAPSGKGKIEIKQSTFENNRSINAGGAMHINLYHHRNTQLLVNGSRFIGNRVDDGLSGWGGAISGGGTGGTVPFKILNSFFQGNSAGGIGAGGAGGALGFAQPTITTIANSTFTENVAEVNCPDTCFAGQGGAMFIASSGRFTIYNSTIANNVAEFVSGAIAGDSGSIYNTIIAHNTALNRGNGGTVDNMQCEARLGGHHNLMFPNAPIKCAKNIILKNPLLGSLTGDVLPLSIDSPALNTGSNSICAAAPVNKRDQEGTKRPQGSTCDLGAFELQGPPAELATLTSPIHNATDVSTTPSFEWEAGANAASYRLEVQKPDGKLIKSVKISLTDAGCDADTTCAYTIPAMTLKANQKYKWFVKSNSPFGSKTTAAFSFRVAPAALILVPESLRAVTP